MELPLDQDYTVELGLDEPDDIATLTGKLAQLLSVSRTSLPPLELRKRSIDARRGRVRFHMILGAKGEEHALGGAPLREPVVIVQRTPAFAMSSMQRRACCCHDESRRCA
jgi:hypothetical protein